MKLIMSESAMCDHWTELTATCETCEELYRASQNEMKRNAGYAWMRAAIYGGVFVGVVLAIVTN